jgi:hypothetical protein
VSGSLSASKDLHARLKKQSPYFAIDPDTDPEPCFAGASQSQAFQAWLITSVKLGPKHKSAERGN